MATSPVAKEVYPLSTNDGQTIPLDIIYPEASIIKSFVASTHAAFTIPAGWQLGAFCCGVDCIVQFGDSYTYPVADGAELPNTLLVPSDTVVVSVVTPGVCRVIPLVAGKAAYLMVQKFTKFAGIGQAKQLTVR